MGSWFGKGGGDSAPPPMPVQQDTGEMAAMMANFENMMMGAMSSIAQSQMAMMELQQPQLPPMPSIPEVARDPVIDWTEKQAQLAAKAKADYNVDEARRKGRSDTILTSPILDEDDATVTGSVLADE